MDGSFLDTARNIKDRLYSFVGLQPDEDGQGSRKKSRHKSALPETAKDIYGDVSDVKPSKNSPSSKKKDDKKELAPEELPDLDLPEIATGIEKPRPAKTSLQKQASGSRSTAQGAESPPGDDEIKLFEDAISLYSGDSGDNQECLAQTQRIVNVPDRGFFTEFERFLDSNDAPRIASEVLKNNLLEKMKEYHMHREEGKPYYFHSDDLKTAMREKLLELRNLERDWIVHKEAVSREESLLIDKEKQIGDILDELKFIMQEVKRKDDFYSEAPAEKYFQLSNGQLVKSLSDLRSALGVMGKEVFDLHSKGNHFAEWIRSVFGREELANRISSCKTREEMIKILDHAKEH